MIQKSRIFNPGADYERVANRKSAAPKEGLSDFDLRVWAATFQAKPFRNRKYYRGFSGQGQQLYCQTLQPGSVRGKTRQDYSSGSVMEIG